MSNNANTIAQFFLSKGVSPAVVAGIVGNLMEESGTDPGSYNSHENALGIAQWEGGRLTNLQNFARQTGGDANSLNTQLNFLWHEMNSTESSAWQKVQGASSAAQAAALWDQYYERSAGTTRQARISYAEQFASTGGISGASQTAEGASHSTSSLTPTQVNGPVDFTQISDGLGSILTHIPELNQLLNDAKANNWTLDEFQNKVENSTWYRTHGETYRQLVALRYSDPTTFNQQYGQGMASAEAQVRQIASAYGFNISDAAVAAQAQAVVYGSKSLDSIKRDYLNNAKSMYPGLTQQLDSGQTVADIASPYVSTMAGLLELDPSTLSPSTTLIKQALQGLPDSTSGKTTPQVVPLWQFENMVRKDPRWQYTSNAKQDAATKLLQIGQTWGYNG